MKKTPQVFTHQILPEEKTFRSTKSNAPKSLNINYRNKVRYEIEEQNLAMAKRLLEKQYNY